jgi:hypothetical protein
LVGAGDDKVTVLFSDQSENFKNSQKIARGKNYGNWEGEKRGGEGGRRK